MDCPFHAILADPDPHDDFNYDDVMVLCLKTDHNPHHDPMSSYQSLKQNDHACVTTMARPYQARRESNRPGWCPLKGDQTVESSEPLEEDKEKPVGAPANTPHNKNIVVLDAAGRILYLKNSNIKFNDEDHPTWSEILNRVHMMTSTGTGTPDKLLANGKIVVECGLSAIAYKFVEEMREAQKKAAEEVYNRYLCPWSE